MDDNKNAPLQSDEENVNDKGQDNADGKKDPSDNLTPDHPRFKEVVAEKNELKETVKKLETKLTELTEQINQRREETGDDELTEQEKASLARIAKGLREQGFLTQEELKVEKRANTLKGLSGKYDGKNGLPKFDSTEVVAYAKKNGFGENYEAAYKDMHFEALVQVASKRGGNIEIPDSEKPTGGEKESLEEKSLDDQIASMSDEEFEKFMTTFKQKSLKAV